jgi:hypothetical protein
MKNNDEEFPYSEFPWKLIHKNDKESRKCFFQTEDHMKKHIQRHKLNKKNYTIGYKYEND